MTIIPDVIYTKPMANIVTKVGNYNNYEEWGSDTMYPGYKYRSFDDHGVETTIKTVTLDKPNYKVQFTVDNFVIMRELYQSYVKDFLENEKQEVDHTLSALYSRITLISLNKNNKIFEKMVTFVSMFIPPIKNDGWLSPVKTNGFNYDENDENVFDDEEDEDDEDHDVTSCHARR
jgi:hypothetical protein